MLVDGVFQRLTGEKFRGQGLVIPVVAPGVELALVGHRCRVREPWFWVWGLGSWVWGLGFGVWGLGFGNWGLGFRV